MRSIPRGAAPKLILAAVAAAMLAPIAAPLLAGRAADKALSALGGLVGGILGDVGQSKLGDLVKRVLSTNKDRPAVELQAALTTELADELTSMKPGAEDLRLEVVGLLHRFDGVETAIHEANASTRDEIARAFGELAVEFAEFSTLVEDVRAGLELVMEAQSHQLALQMEQLELQRQQTSKLNLLIAHVETRPGRRRRSTASPRSATSGSDQQLADTEAVACPYQGLLPFQANDAEHYFGRDLLVAEMVTRFTSERFIAVLGPSGSGKSSAVRAGLLSRLGTGSVPASTTWPAPIVLMPGRRPLEQLAVRLGSRTPTHDAVAIRRQLLEDPSAIRLVVGQQLRDGDEQVLIVDQFEELFTLDPADDERSAFVECLVEAAAEASRLRVVIALRADHLGHCAAYPDLLRQVQDHQVLVSPMTEGELREAIERPAEQVGAVVEPRLVELMVHDVIGEPGALPLLSHALVATWERRDGDRLTVNGYLEAGGVRGAIAATADAIVSSLPPGDQLVARSIMLRLTNITGEVPTRVRVDRAELLTLGSDPERIEAVLDVLTTHRLLTADDVSVEVAHEAVLREWKQFRGWIDEDRLGLALRQDVTTRAGAWDAGGRNDDDLVRGARLAGVLEYRAAYGADLTDLEDSYIEASRKFEQRTIETERRRARRFQLVAAGTAALAIIAAAVTVVAFRQRSNADRQRDRADAAATLADVRRLAADSEAAATRAPDLGALLALEADRLGPDVVEARRRLAAIGTSEPPGRRTFTGDDQVAGAGLGAGGEVVAYRAAQAPGATPTAHVVVYEGGSGEVVHDVDAPNGYFAVAPGGTEAIVATAGEFWRVDLATGDTSTVAVDGAEPGVTLFPSPSATAFVGRRSNGSLQVWDATSGSEEFSVPPLTEATTVLAVSDEADAVATIGPSGTLAVFGPDGNQLWSVFVGRNPQALVFDHAGSVVAVAVEFGTLLYEAPTGIYRGAIPVGAQLGSRIAFSPDDELIAVASVGQVGRWNSRSLIGLGAPAAVGDAIANTLRFGATPDELLLSTSANEIVVLDFADDAAAELLLAPRPGAAIAAFTADGRVVARHDGAALSVVRDGVTTSIAGGPQAASAVAIDPAGSAVAVGGVDVWLFDLELGEVTKITANEDGVSAVRSIVYSPAGGELAIAYIRTDNSTVIEVLDIDGTLRWSLGPSLWLSPAAVGALAWSPAGELLIGRIGNDGRLGVDIYAAAGGDPTSSIDLGPASTDFPTALAVGSSTIVVASNAGRVEVRDLGSDSARSLVSPAGFQTVASVAYDESTASIVAADLSGQIVAWTGEDPDPLFGPLRIQQLLAGITVTTVALGPDGSGLLVGDAAGGVRRLPWGREAWREALCASAGRNLSQAEWDRYLPPGDQYLATCAEFPPGS